MTLGFVQAYLAVLACIRAKVTPLLIGSPGVGKTSLAYALAHEVFRAEANVLIGSNLDPTDIAGFPYVEGGQLRRALLAPIRACVEAPGLLVVDELTATLPSVRPPLMRGVLERVWGDTKLHEGSAVVAIANPPEQAPGGTELTAMEINRMVRLPFTPKFAETRAYFQGEPVEFPRDLPWDPEAYEKALAGERLDWAMTAEVDPSLLQLDPPQASIDSAQPWASPRAVDLGLRALAAYQALGRDPDDDVGFALLAGTMGDTTAPRYAGLRRLRKDLPGVSEVVSRPADAPVPDGRDRQIAALSLLRRVSERDPWAAWIYAERLCPEVSMAAARGLQALPPTAGGDSPHAVAGRKAKIALIGRITRTIQGRA